MFKGEFIGYVVNDAIVKEKNGRKYTSFSIGCSERNNKGENTTIWVGCYINNDGFSSYITKGKQVFLRGDVRIGIYENKVNINCYVLEIQLLGKKDD
jgi:hypothetical protein